MEINILVFYNIDMLISGEDGAGVSGAPSDTVRICVVFAVSDVCDKDCSLPADIWLPWMKTAVDYLMGFGWRLHLFRSVYTQPGWPSLLIWFILPILCCQNMERIFTALSLAAPSFQSGTWLPLVLWAPLPVGSPGTPPASWCWRIQEFFRNSVWMYFIRQKPG